MERSGGVFERLIGAKSRPGRKSARRTAHTWTQNGKKIAVAARGTHSSRGRREREREREKQAAYGVLCGPPITDTA